VQFTILASCNTFIDLYIISYDSMSCRIVDFDIYLAILHRSCILHNIPIIWTGKMRSTCEQN